MPQALQSARQQALAVVLVLVLVLVLARLLVSEPAASAWKRPVAALWSQALSPDACLLRGRAQWWPLALVR